MFRGDAQSGVPGNRPSHAIKSKQTTAFSGGREVFLFRVLLYLSPSAVLPSSSTVVPRYLQGIDSRIPLDTANSPVPYINGIVFAYNLAQTQVYFKMSLKYL